jgi:hypothetical protein
MRVGIMLFISFFWCLSMLSQTDTATVQINDSVSLIMYRTKFDTTNRELVFHPSYGLLAIDGSIALGSDGGIPTYELTRATIRINNRQLELDVSNIFSPWAGATPYDKLFTIKQDGTFLRLRALFSDGAGGYGAEWLIIENSSLRTIITDDEMVLFSYFNDK